MIKTIKTISCQDWDNLVKETYNRSYCFQQQEGCQPRGIYSLKIPCDYADEDEENMPESIPEVINGKERGVKFISWLSRDPNQKIPCDTGNGWETELFWERSFYPSIETIANDLFEKGLIEKGNYTIIIDW